MIVSADSAPDESGGLSRRLREKGFARIPLEDAEIYLDCGFLDQSEADAMFGQLLEQTDWIQPTIRMGKREIHSPRLAAWHGDPDAVYTYSGLRNAPLPWTPSLSVLRERLHQATGIEFNSVLLNLYRSGQDSMGWHRDNEPELGERPVIASLSLGASRRFVMKHVKDPQKRWQTRLRAGSLLIMAGDAQRKWKHAVPKSAADASGQRINLTFRTILRQPA